MDFFKELVELNNKIELKKLTVNYYEIDSEDDEEDIEEINKMRNNIIENYNKPNYKIFKLKK
jgi:hypothetical protein